MGNEKFTIRKAERKKAKLRLGIVGASGSGKTYSALQIAFGLGGKVGIIDTEYGSGELYSSMGDYDVITLDAPYEVARYRQAIRTFEEAGYSTIIIDSISHAWAGEGGLLAKQGKMEDSGRYRNSFATWREITPEHNALIEEMLNSPCHVIATMRAKTEYTLEKDDKGKSVPRKIGMAPVQRDGMEYEFTVVLDLSDRHYATPSKDRTGLFDGKIFMPTKETGAMILKWLDEGVDVAPPKPADLNKRAKKAEPSDLPSWIPLFTNDGQRTGYVGKMLSDFEVASKEQLETIGKSEKGFWEKMKVSENALDKQALSDILGALKARQKQLTETAKPEFNAETGDSLDDF